jgi:hypothetical protein
MRRASTSGSATTFTLRFSAEVTCSVADLAGGGSG